MDIQIIPSLILTAAGILLTYWHNRHARRLANEQMMKQLFTDFNERYGRLNDFLIEIQSNCPTLEELKLHKNGVDLKKKVLDYFNLCAEEYYWYKKGRIDETIWNSWQSGMNYWYRNVPAIHSLWDDEMKANGPQSYYIEDKNAFFKEPNNQA